mmetsp:Transcript_13911/g.58036  ORF Transcript_13911/g.58036 Transcript_13911/m.58036 type:complete len:201 (+) Transcript_13911:530-1132(+)
MGCQPPSMRWASCTGMDTASRRTRRGRGNTSRRLRRSMTRTATSIWARCTCRSGARPSRRAARWRPRRARATTACCVAPRTRRSRQRRTPATGERRTSWATCTCMGRGYAKIAARACASCACSSRSARSGGTSRMTRSTPWNTARASWARSSTSYSPRSRGRPRPRATRRFCCRGAHERSRRGARHTCSCNRARTTRRRR